MEDKVRIKEARDQQETPREYIIDKMELSMLVCPYSDTET